MMLAVIICTKALNNAPEAIRLLRSFDNARGLVIRGIITTL